MKRICILLMVFLLILALAVPVFAATLDPSDYQFSITSTGDGKSLVTYRIPSSHFANYSMTLFNSSASSILKKVYNSNLTYNVGTSQSYWIEVAPFGQDRLDVRDFPASFDIQFNIDYTLTGASLYSVESEVRYQIWWYDEDLNVLEHLVPTFDYGDGGLFAQTIPLTKPAGAVYLGVVAQARNVWFTTAGSINFRFLDFRFTMDMADLAIMQQQTGKTNKLLQSIYDSLNTPPEHRPPGFVEDLDDYLDAEDGLLNKFNDGTLENFGGQIGGVTTELMQYTGAFILLGRCINEITDVTWLNTILICSLGLGLLGSFLGIFVTTSKQSGKGDGKE